MTTSQPIYAEELSRSLNISVQYARRLLRENKIKSFKEGTSYYTTQEAIASFLEESEIVMNPEDRIRTSSTIPKIVALSFFSGAMGLDLGMAQAGISSILACEVNKEARATIVKNNPEIGLIGDIFECTKDKIYQFANLPQDRGIDVIFWGSSLPSFFNSRSSKGL